MTKDVLLSISGLHQDVTGIEAQGDEPGSEPIEVIVPASYYEKNGKHYVIYDELVEGIPGTIKNKVRILMTRRSRSSRVELRIPTWYSRKIRSI